MRSIAARLAHLESRREVLNVPTWAEFNEANERISYHEGALRVIQKLMGKTVPDLDPEQEERDRQTIERYKKAHGIIDRELSEAERAALEARLLGAV